MADRGAIERRLATLKQQLAAKEKAAARPEPEPAPPPPQPTPAPAQPPSNERMIPAPHHSVAPWIVTGLGLASLGTGAVFGVRSRSEHQAAVDDTVQLDAEQHQAAARDDAGRANALFIAGGVLVAGGVIWAIIDRSGGSHSKVSLQVHPQGFAVGWTWR